MSQTPTNPETPSQENSQSQDSRLNKRLKDMPIAIVGMASIFANSRYLNKFWDLISEKIDAITEVPESHWRPEDYFDADKSTPDKSYCKRGGFIPEVDFNPMEFGLPPNILELTDTSQLLSLVIAKEVLADAGVTSEYDTDKIGITLGVGGGQKINASLTARLQYPVLKKVFKSSGLSDADSDMLIKKFQDQYIHWEENSFPGSLGNVIAGRIANRFDLGGMNCVVDAACAGSLAAMRMALTELVEGRSEMMITGGVCTDNSPSMYMSFSKTPAFTTNETIQPFDIDSKGMMIGEGIGMVALKRLEDAERDGDRIYSVIKGVGASSDGKFKSIYAPRPEGQAKALKRAYDDAGFAPETVGLIEAHGTGTAAGDVAEFNGLKSVFGENDPTKQHIALGSVKSQVGHTKSTAGTAGVIKAALALHHKVLPPTINVSKPNPKLNVEDSPFFVNTETRPWMPRPDGTPRRAGISSFGFGGTNFHLVLEEYSPEHSRDDKYRQRQVAQSLLISADNKAALIAEVNKLTAEISALKGTDNSSIEQAELTRIAKQYAVTKIEDSAARLGLVVSSLTELTTQLGLALKQLNNDSEAWQLPSGTSYRSSALITVTTTAKKATSEPKVAALFAGQGSQYVNMGIEVACHFPEMRQQLIKADKVFASFDKTPLSQVMFPIPAFEKADKDAQAALLTSTDNAQSAIGIVSMSQYQLLSQAGFSADMFAGHSFGELSALCAAGVISNDDYYQLSYARGAAMASSAIDKDGNELDKGTMYAIILPANDADAANSDNIAKLETCIAEFDGVKVANYNSATQLVIAGPTESCAQAAKAISALGFKAIALPVSGAFHTPLVGHAQKPFAKAIDKAKFTASKVELFSNASGEKHPTDAKSIKAAFKQHMLQSVRFTDQLNSMYDAGARVFVEFGPKNILQKLVEATLGNKAESVSVISINPNPKGNSDLQLRIAAMQLNVLGAPLTEVDPYQAEIAAPAVPKGMNVKLTASNHISAPTRAKMEKSLTTGKVTSQIVETVVEKVVEVPVEKVVEKIVEKEVIKTEYVEVAASGSTAVSNAAAQAPQKIAPQAPAQSAPASGSLEAFFNAQQQAADLHQQFLAIPQQYGDTFTHLMAEQSKMAAAGHAIPESLQRSMELFHQHQAQTLQSHTLFLEQQAQSSQNALSMLTGQAPVATAPVVAVPVINTPRVNAPIAATPVITAPAPVVEAVKVAAPVQAPVSKPAAMAAPAPRIEPVKAPAPITAPVVAPVVAAAPAGLNAETVLNTMLEVVAEKTGYPTEMLELSMDMEADLGIDSIKRVEILGTVQDELPTLPELSPEDLAECRTLGEIVDYMNSKLPAEGTQIAAQTAVAAPASGLSAETVLNTMLEVVAEKTGYPTEMLELSMDMEADLGIDSIKRVEILGTVQDELPTLPELSPEDLAECRTLGEIVSYMNSKLPAEGSKLPTSAAEGSQLQTAGSAPVGLSAEQVQNTMMTVVAEKTGYPTEMLELSMDMEADLGIDSIKRVEILGTVQDELPGLPELNPEDLAECRTLGEIVSYMNSKLLPTSAAAGANTQAAPAVSGLSAETALSAPSGLSAEQVQSTMMTVVAEKTGYPTEMLELSMDMEADLGIDSIKRVEILGTVQDELPGLPDLNPEDLAECRTLGEIVSYMNSKLTTSSVVNTAASTAAAPTATADLANDLPPHQEVALKKLPAADKLVDCFSKDACIVINDDGHNAGVLAEKLVATGLTVAVIRSPESVTSAQSPLSSDIASFTLSAVSDDAISDVIAQISKQHKIAGFVHLQPQLATSGNLPLSDAGFIAVEQAFLMAKHLQSRFSELAQSQRVSFMTVSRIDGGFGYLNTTELAKAELNQAALSGLTKTLGHEWPNVFCRALDIAPSFEAVELAQAVIAELYDVETSIAEVGVSDQGRHTLTATTAAQTRYQTTSLNSSDTVLVTGGAKGVTFECALTLAKQTQSHFILAGRSEHLAANLPTWAQNKQASELKAAAIKFIQSQGDKPTPKQIDALVWPITSSLEIDRSLAAFKAVGASAEYISMDVSSDAAIKQSLAGLKPITGIIHGAGVLADKHIQDKTLAELGRVYGTKVSGFAGIINAIDASQLKLVAMFSSAAGFYGNTGQSDYSMSNEILNKTALQLAANYPQAKVMSFNWGPWDGGMVSSALKKMFVERGVYVIPLDKGANLFARSLLSESGVQLLIGSSMQGSASTEGAAVKKLNADSSHNAEGSLILSLNNAASHRVVSNTVSVERVLNPVAMPFIEDHCIAGNPVLPTVCAIQWMRETAQQLCSLPVLVQDYKLLKGIIFETKEPQVLTLKLTQTESGLTALIASRMQSDDVDSLLRPQYQASLLVNEKVVNEKLGNVAVSDTLPTVAKDAQQLVESGKVISTDSELYSNGSLFHGPRLQGIKQLLIADDKQLVCSVELPQIDAKDCASFTPQTGLGGSQAFAEDLLLQAMLVWARIKHDAASLPSTIGELTTYAPFASGDSGYLVLNVVKSTSRSLTADIALYHQDGRLSCTMTNAKTTISKSLNEAFLAPAKALADLQESV